MTTPEKKESPEKLVKSKRLTPQERQALFKSDAEKMSLRALVYYGPEGEALASCHAAFLNRFIPTIEGIPGEIEVFGNGDKRFLIGFKNTFTQIDTVVSIVNRELSKQGIESIPELPSLDDLIPDWLRG